MQALQYPSDLVGSLVAFTSRSPKRTVQSSKPSAGNWRSSKYALLHPSLLETFGKSLGLLQLKALCGIVRTAA